ncbi:MAG: type II secretion system protein [Nitrospiraceae bacterium]|nr:MAG: type II secretion system protein [Nitrospiraceae bacterium]
MIRDTHGFTMVEVMIVLIILGTISAVAIPSIRSNLDEIKLDGAVREVVFAIQYTQSLAIKEGIAYTINFDKTQEKFRCFEPISDVTIIHPVDKKPYEIDFTAAGHFQGVDIQSALFSPGNKSLITFNSLGEPDRYGDVIIDYRGYQKTINVSRLTGEISIN